MLAIYDKAGDLPDPYRPTRFKKMVQDYGGKEAADRLLASSETPVGLGKLFVHANGDYEALKISMEYLVLSDPWKTLFTEEQLAVARKRLKDMKVPFPLPE